MAEIINKRWDDPETIKEMEKRRHDLIHHASTSDLYDYNPIIMNLHMVSQMPFHQYITQGIQHWREEIRRIGFIGLDYATNTDSTALFSIPIRFKADMELDADDPASSVYFSIMEIMPSRYTLHEDTDMQFLYEKLHPFITMGLYPLVIAHPGTKDLFDSFEKYEDPRSASTIIGTIVDINLLESPEVITTETEAAKVTTKTNMVATIMWGADALEILPKSLITSKIGYAVLDNFLETPNSWKMPDQVSPINVGVPMFQYYTARDMIYTLTHVDGMIDRLNEAVICGSVKLPFLDKIMALLLENGEEYATKAVTDDYMKEMQKEEQKPSGISASEAGVPIEFAAEKDLFGHRLRLYDAKEEVHSDDDDYPPDFVYGSQDDNDASF